MKRNFFRSVLASAFALGFSFSADAQDTHYQHGDLVLAFQQEGGSNTVYANLGKAADFRGTAAGAADGTNRINFLDINSVLTEAFGSGWASDPTIYAGLAAANSYNNTNATALVDGDPFRTLYVSASRGSVGTLGEADSAGYTVNTNAGMTNGATNIIGQNLPFLQSYNARVVVSPAEVSGIDSQNPFLSTGIQDTAFGIFAGGIQQAGSASSFGSFGDAGSTEFALDLYRILARNTVSGQVAGDLKVGSFEGTVTINSSGRVSFVAQGTEVVKTTPTITTAPTGTSISYGQTLASSSLSGGVASVVGTFAFTTPGTAPATGTSSQGFTFTPTDTTNYNTQTGTVSVTVSKATPTITTAPTATSISYGQTLASSSLSGGVASVVGTFVFTTPSTAPATGTSSQGFTFTPTDTTNYNTQTGTVSVTVSKATPTITTAPTATSISYGQTLSSSTLSGGGASVAGTFAFTTPSTAPATGTFSQGFTFTPSDTTNYSAQTGTVSVTVSKATPTITTAPTATSISYGQTLASSTLSGGVASVVGTFAFTTSSTAPATGTSSQGFTFTPTDTTNYNTQTGTVSVTVSKATPTITTAPTATSISYGQTLASSTLSGGVASVAGTFAFTTPSTAPATGTSSQDFTFTPSDTVNYNPQTGSVSVNVTEASKLNPTINTAPSATSISYGQTLASSTLSGGVASVAGTFAFTTPSTAPGAGTSSQDFTFTPTDTTNYNLQTGAVSVTVSKATPTVNTLPTATSITYGQTLASSTLSGGVASVDGTFDFTTPSTAPTTGTSSQDFTFTPTDTANYNTQTGTVSVTVSKATPTITTAPTATSITYGQTLSSSTLSGGVASVAGTFAFTTSSTAPATGTSSQDFTFTPTDTTNYNTQTGTVSVTVSKATPTITTAPTATSISYGQTLASSSLSVGVASVAGTFAFTTPSTAPATGTSSQGFTFTPTDTTNYNLQTGAVSVTVSKATPTVTIAPTATSISYGQTLASSSLSGGVASVVGTFAFTTSSTAPATGTFSQGFTFTPSDTTNYNTQTGTVSVTVSKATPTITTAPTATSISYGQALSSSTLSGGVASVAGTFAFTTSSTAPATGTSSQDFTFTPTDTVNYNLKTGTVSVTVNEVSKVTPTITTAPTATSISYAQTLASSTLSGGVASVAGTFAFTTPSTAPATGISSQDFTFTPSDTTNYNTQTGTVSVTVSKATPTINTVPTATPITYGQTLASSTLSGGVASVDGTFAFTTPETMPSVGTSTQGFTFTPLDTANYTPITGTVSVATVAVAPRITVQPPSNTRGSQGSGVNLSITATGSPLNYQWRKNGLDLPGKTQKVLVLSNLQVGDAGSYSVRVSNTAGSETSQASVLTIYSSTGDDDGDGLSNADEINQFGTDPGLMDSDGDGLTDTFERACVGISNPSLLRVGDQVLLDFKKLGLPGGMKIVGKLPKGLKFSSATGILNGKIIGNAGTYALTLQFTNGKAIRSIPLPLKVAAFPASLVGSYVGLLEDEAGRPVGMVSIAVSAPGGWSGSLDLIGRAKTLSAKGGFALSPSKNEADLDLVFAKTRKLKIHLDATSALLTGSHLQGKIRGFRLARGNELPVSSRRLTVSIATDEVQDGFSAPAGWGWATGSISSTGAIQLSGQLGDAKAFKIAPRLSATGQAILWMKPYRNKLSSLGGVISLPESGPIMQSSKEQLANGLWWNRAPDATEPSYSAGFGPLRASLGVSVYSQVNGTAAFFESLGLSRSTLQNVSMVGAGLSTTSIQPTLPSAFTLDSGFNLVSIANQGASTLPWTGSVQNADGSFIGQLTLPALDNGVIAGAAAVSGVFHQTGAISPRIGAGMVKIPVTGAKGSYRTAAVVISAQ